MLCLFSILCCVSMLLNQLPLSSSWRALALSSSCKQVHRLFSFKRPHSLNVNNEVKMPNGLLAVYKKQGYSSANVVAKVKHTLEKGYKTKTGVKGSVKVGHGGTLDPLAEGVLVLGVGSGTKLLNSYLSGTKAYHGIGKLGNDTDTQDSEGKSINIVDCSHITLDDIRRALPSFCGEIMQVPPMYSAIHVNGERSFDIARKGGFVEHPPRKVMVYKISLDTVESKLPYFSIDVECGGGCYVRTLIHDIAQSCKGAAHMTSLLRTQHGGFELQDCLHESDFDFDFICDHVDYCNDKVGLDTTTSPSHY